MNGGMQGDWHIVDLRAAADAHPSSGVPLRSTALDPALVCGSLAHPHRWRVSAVGPYID